MGTINYKTSDYITMGINPYGIDDFKSDDAFMKELKNEMEEYGSITGNIDDYIQEYINSLYEDDYINAQHEIEKHNFYFYHVKLEYGYYEGLYIMIENNFGIAYNDYQEKRDAQKEITELCNMLQEIAGYGFVACFPGWSTGYKDYNGTLEEIKKAKKEMRQEARQTPTWLWYERDQHAKYM